MGSWSDPARLSKDRFAAYTRAWVFVFLTLSFSLPALSENAAQDDLLKRGEGLILDTEEDLANVPYTSDYRAFLPEQVDLSDWLPAPGFQGINILNIGRATKKRSTP